MEPQLSSCDIQGLANIYFSAVHRYSLPSGNQNGHSHRSSISGLNGSRLDSFNVPKYLFPSDEDKPHNHLRELERLSTPDIKSYIKLTEPDDKFPTLSRRGDSNMVSFPTLNIAA